MGSVALLARRFHSVSAALVLSCAVASAGCDGGLVNLGTSGDGLKGGNASSGASPGGGPTGSAPHTWQAQLEPIVEQQAEVLLANPTLDRGMTQLFYSAQLRTELSTGIQRAVPMADRFGNSMPVQLGDLMTLDASSPALSLDGDELWLGMNGGPSATDIYRSTLTGVTWSRPEIVPELNSNFDDAPRPSAMNGTVMPLSSKRGGGLHYQIYLATRDSPTTAWSEPKQNQLAAVDASADEFQSADGFLTESGLELYFSSTRPGAGKDSDLYIARRSSVSDDFGEPELLDDLSSPAEERMPWLSPSGDRLYFAANQSGQYALYVATKIGP